MSLALITQLVDDKLRTLALGRELASPLVLGRAIDQAVLQYGLDSPQRLQLLVAGVTGESLAVPTAWVAGRSLLDAVEYPVGQSPMETLAAAVARDLLDEWRILLLTDTLVDATVRVHFTAPHVLTVDECTVPTQHFNAVACWAAAELCRQLATQKGHERDATLSAANTTGASQSGDLARRARDWDLQYRQTLGLPDPDAVPGAAGSSAVTQFDRTRVRGRFSSLGW